MYIITHPGKAHLDDLITTSLIIYSNNIKKVYRRDPAEKELNDKNVFVIDIGNRFEPELNNFDHHQMKEDIESSLSLYLKSINLYDKAIEVFTWIEFLVIKDQFGPAYALDSSNLNQNSIRIIGQPFSNFVCDLFSNYEEIDYTMFIYRLLYKYGKYFFKSIEKYNEAKEILKKSKIINKNVNIIVIDDNSSNNPFLTRIISENFKDVVLVVDSNRNKGEKTLIRINCNFIDFNYIRNNNNVSFVHNSGFLASVKTNNIDEIIKMIENSMNY